MDAPNLPSWNEVRTAASLSRYGRHAFAPDPAEVHDDAFIAGVLWLKGRLAPRAAWPRPDGTPAMKRGGSQR